MKKQDNQQQKNYENEPAMPTVPMQDQFGRVVAFFGLSKVELLAAIVASGYINSQKNGSILFPEVIAGESFELARQILAKGNENREQPGSNLQTVD